MLAMAAVLVVAGQPVPSGAQDVITVWGLSLGLEPELECSAVVLSPDVVVSETVVVRVTPLRTVVVPAEPDGAGCTSVPEGDGPLG